MCIWSGSEPPIGGEAWRGASTTILLALRRPRGGTELKATTMPGHHESLVFHRVWGMELAGKPNREGVPVIENHTGPGQGQAALRRKLSQGATSKQPLQGDAHNFRPLNGIVLVTSEALVEKTWK